MFYGNGNLILYKHISLIISYKLGVVGAGGVIVDPEDNTKEQYAWGLKLTTKNIGKSITLYQRIKIIFHIRIQEVIILGDSSTIIRSLVFNSLRINVKIFHILE